MATLRASHAGRRATDAPLSITRTAATRPIRRA